MKVQSLKNIQQQEALVVFVDQNKKIYGSWNDPVFRDYIQVPLKNDFSGKFKESLLIYLPGHPVTKRVLLIGLGETSELNLQKCRILGAQTAQALAQRRLTNKLSVVLPAIKGFKAPELAEALCLGSQVVQLNYDEWKSKKDKNGPQKEPLILDFVVAESRETAAVQKASERASKIAEAVNFGRRLIAMSPRQLKPVDLAHAAEEVAKKSPMKSKIKTQIWTEKELSKNKYGGILCVAQGSDAPPRLIQLEYSNAPKSKKPVVLVGKGVTFDSGGLSLKPPTGQETMKYDMAGAGSTLAAFKLATDLKLKINLVCLIPAVENMPSGKAQRPGDVVTMANGTTVEVLNTDAEGRLILADALTHACRKFDPACIVDLATLTGACALAVGDAAAGLFTNDPKLIDRMQKASARSGEHVWPLPDFDDFYKDLLISEVADLRNIGKRREGGASTASLFLESFIEKDIPWIHMDIAGCGWYDSPRDMVSVRGPSGVPIRTLFEFIESYAQG